MEYPLADQACADRGTGNVTGEIGRRRNTAVTIELRQFDCSGYHPRNHEYAENRYTKRPTRREKKAERRKEDSVCQHVDRADRSRKEWDPCDAAPVRMGLEISPR